MDIIGGVRSLLYTIYKTPDASTLTNLDPGVELEDLNQWSLSMNISERKSWDPITHCVKATLAPFALVTVSVIFSIQGSGSLLSISVNVCTSLTTVYPNSVSANC